MKIEFNEILLKDADKIVQLWNNNIGEFYPINKELFVQNYKNDRQNKKILGAFRCNILLGFVIFKQWSSSSGVIKANKSVGYINSIIVDSNYINKGVGTALLELAEKELISKGVNHIHVGGDTNHFFPGIPYECKKGQSFFAKKGYVMGENFYDLISDISKLDLKNLSNIKLNADERFKTELLKINERQAYFDFFIKNFSGRWYQEMMDFFEIGMEERDIVVIKDENKIIGFAHIYDDKSRFIGPSIYWRKLLGDNFGGLGPIGIDKDYRKCGLGLLMLYRALEILKNRGVKNMVIDWTDEDILDFYGRFNFIPCKKYRKAEKRI